MNDLNTFSPLSHLIGTPIADVDGVPVGRVIEILVDGAEGRLAYLQFTFEVGSGSRVRKLTIPWSIAEPPADKTGLLRLRVHRSALQALAGSSS